VSNKLNGYIWNLMYDDKAVYYEVREIEAPGVVAVYHLRVPTWEPVLQERIETDVVYETEAFSATYAMLDHGTPSIAYRFEEPSKLKIGKFEQRPGPWISALKDAFLAKDEERMIDVHGVQTKAGDLFGLLFEEKGDSVGYAMDHAATEENHALIEDLMNEVGHLFIECYYHDEDEELARANHHSTSSASGLAARRARARKATPCHFSRRYNDSIESVRAAFETAYRGE
jgi:ribonuclease Z